MAYAGYAVLSDLMYLSNAPAPSSSVPRDPQLVAPLERPLKWFEWLGLPGHKLYATFTPGPAGGDLQYTEMGPEGGKITVVNSEKNGAIRSGNVRWGEWTLVSRSALQAAQSAYLSAIQSASTYHLYFRNSNYYVNSVLIGAGANPRVPGAWTPAFTF